MKIDPPGELPSVPPPVARCIYLRSKTMYISGLAQPGNDMPEVPFYWCNRTLRELGPDGECVDAAPCSDSGRVCHRTMHRSA